MKQNLIKALSFIIGCLVIISSILFFAHKSKTNNNRKLEKDIPTRSVDYLFSKLDKEDQLPKTEQINKPIEAVFRNKKWRNVYGLSIAFYMLAAAIITSVCILSYYSQKAYNEKQLSSIQNQIITNQIEIKMTNRDSVLTDNQEVIINRLDSVCKYLNMKK